MPCARPCHPVALGDAEFRGAAADDLQDRTNRLARWNVGFGKRHGVLRQARDRPVGADERDIERRRRVFHPEVGHLGRATFGRMRREQHAAIGL
jgi:hypothetical protein